MTKTRKPKRTASLPAWLGAWCLSRGVVMPVTEWRFHHERKWLMDFAWPDFKIAIEINGGIWRRGGGAHTGRGHYRDMEKMNAALLLGWRVLQFAPEQVSAAMDALDVVFKTREAKQ